VITVPGDYTIQARAANVVSTGDVSKLIPVISTELKIKIVRDGMVSPTITTGVTRGK
jgi:hypothetical protein